MGYLHIFNLYRPEGKDILLFRECYAMEKIHGTSAHISYDPQVKEYHPPSEVKFFSGGENSTKFEALFNEKELAAKFLTMNLQQAITVYGEAYGGAQQGMKATYGDKLKFVCFDVKIGSMWLPVPACEQIVKEVLGLEFVHYNQVSTNLDALNAELAAESIQAIRNGMGTGHMREGIVLRPLIEVIKNNGERIISKYKNEAFIETEKPRKIDKPLEVLEDAEAIATEWVTEMRLSHILDKLPLARGIESTGMVIKAMQEDIEREGAGEFVPSKDVSRAIARRAAILYKQRVTKVE